MDIKKQKQLPKKPAAAPFEVSEIPYDEAQGKFIMPHNVVMIIRIFAGLIIAVIIVAGLFYFISKRNANEPSYQTVLPSGRSISNLGGWHRVSPPGSANVFAYDDSIDDVKISVSEQPLPASFEKDPSGKVAEFAKQILHANDKIEAGKTVVYVGTSSKGPQSATFTKNNLLVLIKSESAIRNSSWAEYVRSLD